MSAIAMTEATHPRSSTLIAAEQIPVTDVERPPMYAGSSLDGIGLCPSCQYATNHAVYTAAKIAMTDRTGAQPNSREEVFMAVTVSLRRTFNAQPRLRRARFLRQQEA
jgi:hypothetical protein